MCPLSAIELDLHWLCILRIILVSWFLVVSLDYSCNATLRAWMCIGASTMRRTLCQKNCPSHLQIADMSDERTGQSMRTTCSDERNFADSGEMCYGIVILGLVLAPVLTQERQGNRLQHLIHVRLADQVFLKTTRYVALSV